MQLPHYQWVPPFHEERLAWTVNRITTTASNNKLSNPLWQKPVSRLAVPLRLPNHRRADVDDSRDAPVDDSPHRISQLPISLLEPLDVRATVILRASSCHHRQTDCNLNDTIPFDVRVLPAKVFYAVFRTVQRALKIFVEITLHNGEGPGAINQHHRNRKRCIESQY